MEKREVRVPVGSDTLEGNLDALEGARGSAVRARQRERSAQPRNRYVAEELRGLLGLLVTGRPNVTTPLGCIPSVTKKPLRV